MPERDQWEDLPAQVREAIEEKAGTVVKAEPISEGINSDVTLVLHLRSDRLFVKGSRTDNPRRMRSLGREAVINPYVVPISPALAFEIETAGWKLLGWEYIDGRRIDYSPGSPDIPKIVETLAWLAEIECPDLGFPELPARMKNFTPEDDLWRFAGSGLLHTDPNPGNVRIANGKAYLVDWACPTRGIAWSDAAEVALCLITCGHTPADAERIIADLPVWRTADTTSVEISVASTEATWTGLYPESNPDPWINATVAAARRWAAYRRDTHGSTHRGAPR
ncbi:hypothetical protein GCM10022254_05240 [Actinomadura meridiana]|uniref:Phosphotransferase n=1 Tax=Actinomadura meridiana TaxID=559626 RepID=A0ABP8BSR2_9ACTN